VAIVADSLRPRIEDLDARAERDAARLRDRVPVFLGGAGVAALVATRAKCQVNENAELPAFANELPEADHNEIVGWGSGPDVPYTIVPIRDAAGAEHGRIAARFDITGALLEEVTDAMPDFRLPDGDVLLRLAAGVAYVDLLSVHLALQRQVDPTPVERIGELKRRMEAV
jgi:glucose/mannose-6-phosphate isomerase